MKNKNEKKKFGTPRLSNTTNFFNVRPSEIVSTVDRLGTSGVHTHSLTV